MMIKSFTYLIYINAITYLGDIKRYVAMIIATTLIVGATIAGSWAATDAQEEAPIEIGLKMDAKGVYSGMLRSSFFNESAFNGVVDIDTIKDDDDISEYDATVFVPEDFFDALMYFEHSPMKVSINSESIIVRYLLFDMVENYSKYIRSVEASVTSLYDVMKEYGYERETRLKYNEMLALDLIQMALRRDHMVNSRIVGFYSGIDIHEYYFMALMTLAVWFLSLSVGMKWLQSQHWNILRRYLISGQSLFLYVVSFFVVSVLLLFTFVSVVIFILTWKELIDVGNIKGYTLIIFLMCCLYCALMIFVANLLPIRNTFSTVAVVLGMLISVAGGVVMPLFEMSEQMLCLAKITPNYWFIRLQISVFKEEIIPESRYVIFIVLLVTILLLWLSSRISTRRWLEDTK